MCTVYSIRSIAEEFKSDDEVNISTETKDTDVTEEVYIFFGKSDQLWTRIARLIDHPQVERYCRQDSKKYEVNVRGGLWPEQFAIKVGPVFLKIYELSL